MFKKEIIGLVIRQTNYSQETAIEKLNYWDGNHLNVIKEYLNPNFNKKKKKKKISTNQKIIKGIRNYMDNIAIQYEKRKQMKKDIMETMKLEQEGKIAEKKFNEKRKREEEMKKVNKLKEEEEKQKQQAYENKNDGVTLDEI
jgi:hypothetical protein